VEGPAVSGLRKLCFLSRYLQCQELVAGGSARAGPPLPALHRGGGQAHRIFTGKLARKHLSFPDRAMASAVRAAEGDFRNWAEIRA